MSTCTPYGVDARFWAMAPGALVGTLQLRADPDADEVAVARAVRAAYETRLGRINLTVQVEK